LDGGLVLTGDRTFNVKYFRSFPQSKRARIVRHVHANAALSGLSETIHSIAINNDEQNRLSFARMKQSRFLCSHPLKSRISNGQSPSKPRPDSLSHAALGWRHPTFLIWALSECIDITAMTSFVIRILLSGDALYTTFKSH
jgi:hypothetical protein